MIYLKPVLYSKIGNHTDGLDISYKYYLGSVDPHFYFAVYVTPKQDIFDLFFIPQVNNILDNGIIDMGEDSVNSVRGVSYGEDIELVLTNPYLEGFGRVINVSFSINTRPIAVNSSSVTQVDLETANIEAKHMVQPIVDIGLHTLANVALIEVASKMNNILKSSVGVNQENVVPTIIKGTLSVKKMFIDSLPVGTRQETADKLYMLYSRLLNVSPHSSDMPTIFADAILFARIVYSENIDILSIPYEILFRLVADWMRSKHNEYIILLTKASMGIIHSEDISINMSTMEDVSKVYEILNKTQAFVYLTNIKFTNDDNGESIDFPMDNEYFKNYIKTSSDCIETKGIPSSNGTIFIQYGYGTGCDEFVGLFSIDNNGSRRGLRRDDKLIGDSYVIARTWEWDTNKTVKTEGQIDSSGNITVSFIGV